MKRTTVTLIRNRETGRLHVTVAIGGEEYVLGVYETSTEAGARMRRWVDGRGLAFAPGSAWRLDQAAAIDSDVLILDVVNPADYAAPTPEGL